MGSTCNDFCSCGDHCKNQPNEAPEPIGVFSSSDPDDLDMIILMMQAVLMKVMLISNSSLRTSIKNLARQSTHMYIFIFY